MKKFIIVGLIAIGILLNCQQKINPSTADITYCQAAEAHLVTLKCIGGDGKYTAAGKSFSVFCTETMQAGVPLSPQCISQITTCSEINSCVQNGEK